MLHRGHAALELLQRAPLRHGRTRHGLRQVVPVLCDRARAVRALAAQIREALLLHVPGQQPLVPPARQEMSRRLEIGALVVLCFFLPLYEAPKNIFCALYIVVWIVNRFRERDFGGRWDAWDGLIAAWIASGFV